MSKEDPYTMAASMRKLLALVATAALLFTLVAAMPGDSSAANLTGGTYTYVINGEEVTFPIDPISRKDGLLLPTEVFQKFDITVDGALKSTATLSRNGVTVTTTVGSPVIKVVEDSIALPTVPLRLNGRLFLPSDLLKYFGVDYVLDGNFLTMRDLGAAAPEVKGVSEAELAAMKVGRRFTASVRAEANVFLDTEFTILTEEMLNASSLKMSFGNRVRLLSLLPTNTLVMVKLANPSLKSGALSTTGLYMVDQSLHRQYEVVSVFDLGEGLLTGKLAPTAERTGVLVFPKLVGHGSLNVHYDTHGSTIGTFTNP